MLDNVYLLCLQIFHHYIFILYFIIYLYLLYIFIKWIVETHVTFYLLFLNVLSQIRNLLFEVKLEFMLFLF